MFSSIPCPNGSCWLIIYFTGIEAPKPKNETRIEYTGFLDAARDFQLCDRRTTDYDQEFQRTCGLRRIRSADAAITAANNSFNDYQAKGKNLHYDSMKCNCEHWVLAWKYGLAWSIQINNWVLFTKKTQSAECQAPGADKCSW